MLQLKKLITKTTLAKLYKAFILMHFQHYSSVWHFCGARNAENLENLIKGFLDLLGDLESTFNILLSEVNNLCERFFDSEDDYRTGCQNVSHCQQQQSYSGLRSPGRSNSTYF